MTYTQNIPQATDDPSQSQSQILNNFIQLNTQYGTSGDHVPFTASGNNGKHNKVTWLDQTASIPGAPGASSTVAYGLTQSGVTMPYYKRDAVATQFPLSPIKAYASFVTLAGTGAITPLDSFNINTINQGSAISITLTLTNACRTTNYGIIAFGGANNPIPNNSYPISYTIVNASTFIVGVFANASRVFNMTVMVLET